MSSGTTPTATAPAEASGLGPLDEALLRYTGLHLHRATIPTRRPEAVTAHRLPQVLEVIATAERSCTGMHLSDGWLSSAHTLEKKREWERIQKAVERAVRDAHPDLTDDAVRAVGYLMCSEAAERARTT